MYEEWQPTAKRSSAQKNKQQTKEDTNDNYKEEEQHNVI